MSSDDWFWFFLVLSRILLISLNKAGVIKSVRICYKIKVNM